VTPDLCLPASVSPCLLKSRAKSRGRSIKSRRTRGDSEFVGWNWLSS
jgi:hypothetical protein